MPETTVTEDLVLPNGAAPSRASVTYRLVGTGGHPIGEAYVDGTTIVSFLQITPNTEGETSVDLWGNDAITPAGTRWRRDINPASDTAGRSSAYLDVPDDGGTYRVDQLLDDPPGTIGSSALAVHAALRGPGGHLPDGTPDEGDTIGWNDDDGIFEYVPQTAAAAVLTVNGRIGNVVGLAEQVDLTAEADERAAADLLLIPLVQKGAANGVAPLDAGSKIPAVYLPAIGIVDVYVVADIPARDALTVQEGDVAVVVDATADPGVDAGGASYIYDGTAWQRLLTPTDAVLSVDGRTGPVTLSDLYDAIGAAAAAQAFAIQRGNHSGNQAIATVTGLQAELDGKVPLALVDAKGDELLGTAADTLARLPVGTTRQVRTPDPTAATGQKWAAPDTLLQSLYAGVRGTIYGDSWSAADTYTTPGARWWNLLQRRLDLGKITNNAVNGTGSIQHLRALMVGAVAWTLDQNRLVFLNEGTIEQTGGADPVAGVRVAQTFQDTVRNSLRRLGAGTVIESSTWTETGAWSPSGTADAYSAGSGRATTTAGAKASFQFTGTEVWIQLGAVDASVLRGRLIDIVVDTVTVVSGLDPTRLATAAAWSAFAHGGINTFVVEISGLTNALHTVEIVAGANSPIGAGTGVVLTDCAMVPSATPPLAVVLKAPRLPVFATQPEWDAWSAALDAAAAGIGYAVVVNLNDGFDSATMLGADGAHLNDIGTQHAYRKVLEALAARTSLPWGTAVADALVGERQAALPVTEGGTALTSLGAAKRQLRVNAAATALEYAQPRSVIVASGVDSTVINTVVETTLITAAVPTDLVAGDMLRLTMFGTLLNNSGASVTYSPRWKLGATTFLSRTPNNQTTNALGAAFHSTVEIVVGNPASSQRAGVISLQGGVAADGAVAANGALLMSFVGRNESLAEDLTSAKNLVFTIEMGTAAAAASFTVRGWALEVIRAA